MVRPMTTALLPLKAGAPALPAATAAGVPGAGVPGGPRGKASHGPATTGLHWSLADLPDALSQLLFYPKVAVTSDGSVPGLLPGCAPQPADRCAHACVRVLGALAPHLVLFCLLHVQFCKAHAGCCVSQLICLQRELVSRSATTLPGFMITTRQCLPPNSAPLGHPLWGQLRSRLQPSGIVGTLPDAPSRPSSAPPGVCPLVCCLSVCRHSGSRISLSHEVEFRQCSRGHSWVLPHPCSKSRAASSCEAHLGPAGAKGEPWRPGGGRGVTPRPPPYGGVRPCSEGSGVASTVTPPAQRQPGASSASGSGTCCGP